MPTGDIRLSQINLRLPSIWLYPSTSTAGVIFSSFLKMSALNIMIQAFGKLSWQRCLPGRLAGWQQPCRIGGSLAHGQGKREETVPGRREPSKQIFYSQLGEKKNTKGSKWGKITIRNNNKTPLQWHTVCQEQLVNHIKGLGVCCMHYAGARDHGERKWTSEHRQRERLSMGATERERDWESASIRGKSTSGR